MREDHPFAFNPTASIAVYEVPLAGARQASAFVDVFNLFNANPEQNRNWSSGSAFLAPQVIVAPRVARAGVRIDW